MSVSAGVATVREKLLKGNIGQTKVHRYWTGKRPGYAENVDEDEDEVKPEQKPQVEQQEQRHEVPEAVIKDDPRLRRLAESRRNREEAIARHREIRKAEIISTDVADGEGLQSQFEEVTIQDDAEDEDALQERRRRNRERILQKQQEEETAAAVEVEELADEEDEEEEEEEEESEYETDSEEETMGIPMVKPLFVRKSERETIAEREKLEAEEQAMHEAMHKKLEARKLESQQLLIEVLKKEKDAERNKPEDFDGEDVDTDDENPAEEYEAWKAREIARIKKERDEREAAVKEKQELERVRNMDEDEKLEYFKNNPKPAPAPKKKQAFMQRYYHKGAFFQTDSEKLVPGGTELFTRDYSQATGEDKHDKSLLPKIMQVRSNQFGKSGRTKHTHLVAEDTTRRDSPWASNDEIRNRYLAKLGGMKPIPMKRKRS